METTLETEEPEASERLWTAVTPEFMKKLDDYYREHRFRTRSEAIRHLIELGLHSAKQSLT